VSDSADVAQTGRLRKLSSYFGGTFVVVLRSLLFPLLLILLCACDPAYHVEGLLVDPAGKPLSGATVTKICPKEKESVTTITDGRFSFGGVGGAFEAGSCNLRIDAPGFQQRTLSTQDACYRNTQDGTYKKGACKPDDGKITLTPGL